MGASTVVQLADESGLNRVTVHDIVGRLVDKGLFLETRSGQRRLVYPKQIDALQSLVEIKRSELTQLQSTVDQTMSLLRDVQLSSTYLPQIRFYK
jgi:predicted transcriptional regulator